MDFPNGRRILLAGDLHKNFRHTKYIFKMAQQNNCDWVVALGDVGYWPRGKKENGLDFFEGIEKLTQKYKIDFAWLPGNHDDWDVLETVVKIQAESPQQMTDHIWFLGHGCQWTWGTPEVNERSFMSFGGAYSIDQQWRKQGWDWFPQELPSWGQQDFALGRPPVDILLTHDAPWGTVPFIDEQNDPYPLSAANRMFISSLVESAQPKALFHGHYHERLSRVVHTSYGFCTMDGLDCDNTDEKSWLVLAL